MSNPVDPAERELRPRTGLRRLLDPPGIVMVAVTCVVIGGTLEAASRDSFGVVYAGLAWPLIGWVWLARLVAALIDARLRMSLRTWARWLVIPALFGIALILVSDQRPFQIRLALSRDAMNRAAASVASGGSTDMEWIGLWPVEFVERFEGGMRFVIAGSGFIDQTGLAYSMRGMPPELSGREDYADLGGGWWRWTSRFN